MNTTKLPQSTEAPAVGVPVERMVRPAAWALAKDGSPYMLMYERDKRSDVYSWAPLYDQAALDAAVAAERERCAKVCEDRRDRELANGSTQHAMAADDCAKSIRRA